MDVVDVMSRTPMPNDMHNRFGGINERLQNGVTFEQRYRRSVHRSCSVCATICHLVLGRFFRDGGALRSQPGLSCGHSNTVLWYRRDSNNRLTDSGKSICSVKRNSTITKSCANRNAFASPETPITGQDSVSRVLPMSRSLPAGTCLSFSDAGRSHAAPCPGSARSRPARPPRPTPSRRSAP